MTRQYQDIHKEIIELSKTGNRKAQYELYSLYSKAMFNICFRLMNHKEEAEDMLQEAFTEAFKKLGTFRYESSFGAWLKRIVINRCLNALKKRKAELVLVDDTKDFAHQAEDETIDYEEIEMSVKKIQDAMQQLPGGYRVIFSLYLLEGYDHAEIAQILGVSESTSKSQYSRARQKVKEILKS